MIPASRKLALGFCCEPLEESGYTFSHTTILGDCYSRPKENTERETRAGRFWVSKSADCIRKFGIQGQAKARVSFQ